MSVNLEKKVVQIMIRLSPDDARRVDDLAHNARISVSAFCKELVLGRLPPKAPPVPAEQSPAATRLIKICAAAGSNLTQILGHATSSTDPILGRLVAEKVLQKLAEKVLNLGLSVKTGHLPDGQIYQIQEAFEAPAAALNDLAKSLNEGRPVALARWGQALKDLQIVLDES